MHDTTSEPITGTAAGVPFTALPPAAANGTHGTGSTDSTDSTGATGATESPAPLIVTWHMMDAPCTDAAFAAALPLLGVPAWRVHLGLPWCGVRTFAGGREESERDPMMRYVDPVVRQAVDEFPAALAALRDKLPTDGGPIGIIGGSLGGAVALSVLAGRQTPVAAAALVNPAIRARSVVELIAGSTGRPYPWSAVSEAAADRLDFVALAGNIAGNIAGHAIQPPVLVVSGELDYPVFRTDAAALVAALTERYAQPRQVRLTSIADLAHPLAERPGLEPAPQLATAKLVDEAMTTWFLDHF